MQSARMSRLARLEKAITPSRRSFLLWIDADAAGAEAADHVKRVQQGLNMTDGDVLLVLSWLPATDR